MNPTSAIEEHELRQFGLTVGGLIAAIFGALLPLVRHHTPVIWPWVLSIILCSGAIVSPKLLWVVYRPWMAVGHVMGWVQTRLLLSVVFYLIIFPIGLIRKLGKLFQGGQTADVITYRVACQARSKESMEKPF